MQAAMVLSHFSRRQAFFTHLAVSTIIFVVLSWLIVQHWYPSFYFFSDGGDRAIATIFFVDVVLGPGLTLLVFKPGKKSLKFDMAVILIMQFSALLWGVNKVYSERPAASVYYMGSFTCVAYPDAGKMNLDAIAAGPAGRQRLGFLQRPDTVDELLDFSKQAYAHNSSAVHYYGDLVAPLDARVRPRLDKYELDMAALQQSYPEFARSVQAYMNSPQFDSRHHKLAPLQCRYSKPLAVLDTRQMRIVDWLDSPGYLSTRALDEPLPLSSQVQSGPVEDVMDAVVKDVFQTNAP